MQQQGGLIGIKKKNQLCKTSHVKLWCQILTPVKVKAQGFLSRHTILHRCSTIIHKEIHRRGTYPNAQESSVQCSHKTSCDLNKGCGSYFFSAWNLYYHSHWHYHYCSPPTSKSHSWIKQIHAPSMGAVQSYSGKQKKSLSEAEVDEAVEACLPAGIPQDRGTWCNILLCGTNS